MNFTNQWMTAFKVHTTSIEEVLNAKQQECLDQLQITVSLHEQLAEKNEETIKLQQKRIALLEDALKIHADLLKTAMELAK